MEIASRLKPFDMFHFAYDGVMSSLWHREPRLPKDVHHAGLSASRQAYFPMADFWKGDEEQQASTVIICESTMDLSCLLL